MKTKALIRPLSRRPLFRIIIYTIQLEWKNQKIPPMLLNTLYADDKLVLIMVK